MILAASILAGSTIRDGTEWSHVDRSGGIGGRRLAARGGWGLGLQRSRAAGSRGPTHPGFFGLDGSTGSSLAEPAEPDPLAGLVLPGRACAARFGSLLAAAGLGGPCRYRRRGPRPL